MADRETGSGHLVSKVLLTQLGMGVAIAGLLWGLYGRVPGYSALLGTLICVLPNGFLALRLVVPRRRPDAILQAAYIGEIGKLALTVLLFTLAFTAVRPLSAAGLFAGFIVAQLGMFAAAFLRDGSEMELDTRAKHGE